MDLYHRQLHYVFNRPVDDPPWYWQPREEAYPFGEEEDAMTAFLFFENLCRQPGLDLASYSDAQVGLGLTYLFDASVCSLTQGFKVAPVPVERKVAALQALFALFEEVLEPRCTQVLSAHSKAALSPLSYICYMFWDVTPLATWMKLENPEQISMSFVASLNEEDYARMNLPEGVRESLEKQLAQTQVSIIPVEALNDDTMRQYQNMAEDLRAYYHAIATVMGRCLGLRNPACIESGLHGLGHLATFQADIAVPILDRFLKNNKKLDTRLLRYAEAARTGMIL